MTNYLKDKRTFAEWLSRQTDLTLDAVWLGMQNNHRNQFMRRFAAYRSRAEMPEMDEMMQIIGEETTAMMRLAAAALPTASGAEKKQFVVEAVLAIGRYLYMQSESPSDEEWQIYTSEVEPQLLRPMLDEGIEQAYPYLRGADLV